LLVLPAIKQKAKVGTVLPSAWAKQKSPLSKKPFLLACRFCLLDFSWCCTINERCNTEHLEHQRSKIMSYKVDIRSPVFRDKQAANEVADFLQKILKDKDGAYPFAKITVEVAKDSGRATKVKQDYGKPRPTLFK
jgi:hypothetical protein